MDMARVCSIGELLIDFTPAGKSGTGNVLFERNPGGGPANVAVAVSMLGVESAFLGKVGKDMFGLFLRDVLSNRKVDVSGLVFSENVNTTLAFVHLDDRGDRSFSFYRNPGADMMYESCEIAYGLIDTCDILHFSSVSLTHEPSRTAVKEAVAYGKKKKKIISYDPNLRKMLWDDEKTARKEIAGMLPYADILKVSDEELLFLTGEKDVDKATSLLYEGGNRLIFSTLGPRGCLYMHKNGSRRLKTYDTAIVDTTGSGDAYVGAVLFKILQKGTDIGELTDDTLHDIADFANAAGSVAATRKGAIPSMPTEEQVEDCRKNTGLYEA
ncbi:MAG: carbohydrate kinase [Clostridia bacterium]